MQSAILHCTNARLSSVYDKIDGCEGAVAGSFFRFGFQTASPPSFRGALLGASPESILTARLALGPFAQSTIEQCAPLIFANAASHTRVVVMDSGFAAS